MFETGYIVVPDSMKKRVDTNIKNMFFKYS